MQRRIQKQQRTQRNKKPFAQTPYLQVSDINKSSENSNPMRQTKFQVSYRKGYSDCDLQPSKSHFVSEKIEETILKFSSKR